VVRSMMSLLARNSKARRRSVSETVSSGPEAGATIKFHSAQVMSTCHGTLHKKQALLPHETHLTMGSPTPPSCICPLPQPAAH
jgi:hypothetical protein